MNQVQDSDYESLLDYFFTEFIHVVRDLLDLDLQISSLKVCELQKLENQNEVLALLDFRGSSIGHLAIQCTESTLDKLCKSSFKKKKKRKKEKVGDIFKEILNNVSGRMVPKLKNHIPIITILTPKIIYGEISFSETPCKSLVVETHLGHFKFTISFDEMQLDILRLLDEAEQANQAKSDFLATMTHEFRTPIHGMMGMTELLMSTPLNSEQKDYISTISDSASALLAVINDILDYSKIEADKMAFEELDFDLYELAESSIDIVSSRVYAKNLDIALVIAPEVPQFLISDPNRLRQVFLNLLSNSLKFTEEGNITFKISCLEKKKTTATLMIEIIDTGIGISPNGLKKLFQSFSQVDPSHTRKYGGTGLGLAICKMMIEKMGGKIQVKSKENVGSNFNFTLNLPIKLDQTFAHLCDLKGQKFISIGLSNFDSHTLKHYINSLEGHYQSYKSLKEVLKAYERIEQIDACFIYHDQLLKLTNSKKFINQPIQKNIQKLVSIQESLLSKHLTPEIKGTKIEQLTKPIKVNKLKGALGLSTLTQLTSDDGEKVNLKEGIKNSCKLLIAEDNLINQKVITKMCEKLGLNYELASNGHEVIELFEKNKFDIIFMDFQMPQMDGLTATQKIREIRGKGEIIPIIALTANDEGENKDKALSLGMNDFVSKPMKAKKLVETLEKWCPK